MRQIVSGVYTITNLKNNKIYVGETFDVHRRLKSHKNDLINARHGNIHLQRAFDIDGLNLFIFELLESYPISICPAMEHYWCNILKTHDPNFGYNIRLTTTLGKVGKHSDESKRKLSLAHTGKIISIETRKNMSLAQLKRDNAGGQYRSPEAKLKIAQTNISRQKTVYQYALDGTFLKEWESRKTASEYIGISYSGICNASIKVKGASGGFIWSLIKKHNEPYSNIAILNRHAWAK